MCRPIIFNQKLYSSIMKFFKAIFDSHIDEPIVI